MKKEVKQEVRNLIKVYDLNCSIKEFKDEVNWNYISQYQKLSLDFIREFKSKVDWYYISRYQKLSENFILEFVEKVDVIELAKRGLISKEKIIRVLRESKRIKITSNSSKKINTRFEILDI